MKSLVLAAGMSTRLAALTGGAPKPLTPVAGVPVLHRNLRWLASHGISETFINLHHRGDEIRNSVGDGSAFGVRVRWSPENPILGTAGAAKSIERDLASEGRFLLVYGDNLFGFDLRKLIDDHLQNFARDPSLLGTIAVFDVEKHLHTGIAGGRVAFGADGRITGFVEGVPGAKGHVNAACYILEPAVMEPIPPPPQASDWMRDVFPKLLAKGGNLRAHIIDGYCLGIDTPESYHRAEAYFREGKIN